MGLNRILTSGNAALSVTTFLGSTIADIPTLEGVPLGTVDGTATGEVAAKVMVVGATALTIAAGTANIGDVDVASIKGAANLAITRATATGTAATLVAARATRRSVLITNLADPDTDPDDIAYVGPATVTTANGYPVYPGQSVPFTWVGLIQVIDDGTNHPAVVAADEYD